MKIIKSQARPSKSAPPEWFSGSVWIDAISAPSEPSRLHAVRVTFAPGARTAWHTHPLGQVLHVLSGVGRVQVEGEEAQTVEPGDTVVFEPGVKHWHGAAAGHVFVHLALQEEDESGSTATWLEHVSDEEYSASL